MYTEPSATNQFLSDHAALLLRSFRHWTGNDLIPSDLAPEEQARRLFDAPFVVVSHDTAPIPIFNYGNRAALTLFEMPWDAFTALPSRHSAPPVDRDERERLLAAVTRDGFIKDYRGIRITRTGRRFWMEDGIVWNLLDAHGRHAGQAATFSRWTFIDAVVRSP